MCFSISESRPLNELRQLHDYIYGAIQEDFSEGLAELLMTQRVYYHSHRSMTTRFLDSRRVLGIELESGFLSSDCFLHVSIYPNYYMGAWAEV